MRKNYKFKSILLIIILTIFIFPTIILAETCTSTTLTGHSSSLPAGSSSGSGCNTGVCSSGLSSNPYALGVRVQLYHYNPKTYKATLIGKGVDLWATNKLKNDSYHFSKPNTNNLAAKISCQSGSPYGTLISSIYTLSYEKYLDGNYGNVYYEPKLNDAFKDGGVDLYLLTQNSKTNQAETGWIKTNILNKIDKTTSGDNSKKIKEFKELFNLTDKEISDMQSNTNDYYITAEVLYRWHLRTGDSRSMDMSSSYVKKGGKRGAFYYGTVSEAAAFHGDGIPYRALWMDKGKVGQLVDASIYGSFKIKRLDPSKKVSASSKYNFYSRGESNVAACSSAYGYAVWNLATICWDCTKSCSNTCDAYEVGSTGRQACATAYCNANEKSNVSSCISSCNNVPDYGCENGYNNTCKTYSEKNGTQTKSKSTDNKCDANGKETSDEELKTRVCYDDGKAYKVIDDSGKITDVGAYYKERKIRYYKIECDENLKLSKLPKKTKLYVTNSNTANLYIGYKMEYKKVCNLYYRATEAEKKKTKNQWTQNYNNSELKKAIKDNQDLKKITWKELQKQNKNLSKADAKTLAASMKATATEALAELEKVQGNAQQRLKNVSNVDYSNKEMINKAYIQVDVTEKDSRDGEVEVPLEPVYCIDGNSVKETFCNLEKNTDYIIDESHKSTVKCTDANGKETKATLDSTKTKSVYTKTVYYSLPSSWIAAQAEGKDGNEEVYPGKVYHNEKECKKAVDESGGYCIEKENTWVFEPLDTNIDVDSLKAKNFKLEIKGFGSCGQFEYGLQCEYEPDEGNACKQCANLDPKSKEYQNCFDKYCGCDAYCGSNVACRAKYCPEPCEGCGWSDEACNACQDECADKSGNNRNSKEYVTCKYNNCCRDECNGATGCIYNCCVTECAEKAEKKIINQSEYNLCITSCRIDNITTTDDPDPNGCKDGRCGGTYFYRTITMEDGKVFPDRDPGLNWYNREKFIINSQKDGTIYYDKTDGKTSEYEYKIELTSKDIKNLQEYKNNNSYFGYNKAEKAKSKIDDKVYCSSMLYDYLGNKIKGGIDGTGSGCVNK